MDERTSLTVESAAASPHRLARTVSADAPGVDTSTVADDGSAAVNNQRKRKPKKPLKLKTAHVDSDENRDFVDGALMDFAGLLGIAQHLSLPTQFSLDHHAAVIRMERTIAVSREVIDRVGNAIYNYMGGYKRDTLILRHGNCGKGGVKGCEGCPHPAWYILDRSLRGGTKLQWFPVRALSKHHVRSNPKLRAMVEATTLLIQMREDQIRRLRNLRLGLGGSTNLQLNVIHLLQQARALHLLSEGE